MFVYKWLRNLDYLACTIKQKQALASTMLIPKLFAISVLVVSLQACQNSEMQDLKQFVATAYQNEKPEIEPLPEIKPYKEFTYAASESADPFNLKNIITGRGDGIALPGDRPDANRPREPLELLPLDALKMVGTMIQGKTPWVIVQTSDGIAHRVTVGNYMGQNEGKIKRIIPDEQKILLAELVLDPAGRWVTREIEITIDE